LLLAAQALYGYLPELVLQHLHEKTGIPLSQIYGVIKAIKVNLDIEEDQTTLDMNFTFETVACFGACALSPLIMVDKKYFGNMDSRKIETV